MTIQTQDELKSWLESQGFRDYHNGMAFSENRCKWYACKRYPSQYVCELNDDKEGVQIVIWPYEWEINGHHCKSVEVDLTGEAGGIWYKLQAYSLLWDDLPHKLPEITESLIKAWESLPRP